VRGVPLRKRPIRALGAKACGSNGRFGSGRQPSVLVARANTGADHDPAKVESRRRSEAREDDVPVFDMERFYAGLCWEFYDEGL
jgi:hypothetical protein